MKPARIAAFAWLGNLVLLGGVACFLWFTQRQAMAQRNDRLAAVANARTAQARIDWKDTLQHAAHGLDGFRLSPQERPKPPVVRPPVEPPEHHVKTDAELKADLERALSAKFGVARLILCNSPGVANAATVLSGNVRMEWFAGTNLKKEYADARSPALRQFALDINVLRIDEQGVLINAPSFEEPDKRFDILLKVRSEPGTMSVDAGYASQSGVLKIEGADPERTADALKRGGHVLHIGSVK